MKLSQEELSRICNWKPYRDDWPIDRNVINDNIELRYGQLISSLNNSEYFTVHQTETGGNSNYLGFDIYPTPPPYGNAPCLHLCVCLCAPLAAYCEHSIAIKEQYWERGFLNSLSLNQTHSDKLAAVQVFVLKLLNASNIEIVPKEDLEKPLPKELGDGIWSLWLNHNELPLILHGLFQVFD